MVSGLILITGVSGFIGFKTMILALEAGYQVRAVVRKSEQTEKLKKHPRIYPYTKNIAFEVVPDLAQTNAFDPILEGVTEILHLASPLAIETDEYERDIVSASDRRVELRLRSCSQSSFSQASHQNFLGSNSDSLRMALEPRSRPFLHSPECDLNSNPAPPFHSSMEAYWASKALSRIAAHKSFAQRIPNFEIINLLPPVVIGPDELATSAASLLTNTRALAMAPILGQRIEMPLVGVQVHVDDVARAHVDALKKSVPGNADYILTSDGVDRIEWDAAKEMVKKGVPQAAEKLELDGTMPTMKWKIDASTTEKAFGWKFRSFEETMKDLVRQYLELLERAAILK